LMKHLQEDQKEFCGTNHGGQSPDISLKPTQWMSNVLVKSPVDLFTIADLGEISLVSIVKSQWHIDETQPCRLLRAFNSKVPPHK
jgi:hypothetical protein